MASYPTYRMDDSEIKSIARGNPAVVLVENGKLVWKRTLASLDDDKVRVPDYPVGQYNSDYRPDEVLSQLVKLYLLSLLALLLVNRTHVAVRLFYRKLRRRKSVAPVSEEASDAVKSDKE